MVHAAQVMPRSARGIAEDVRFPLSLYELVTTSRLPAIISLVPRLILKPDLKINGSDGAALQAHFCEGQGEGGKQWRGLKLSSPGVFKDGGKLQSSFGTT